MRKVAPALLLAAAAACGFGRQRGDRVHPREQHHALHRLRRHPERHLGTRPTVRPGRKSRWHLRRGGDHQQPAGALQRLQLHPDYFRNPPEFYIAGDPVLGRPTTTWHLPPRPPGDEGTTSEIIGVKQLGQVAPFQGRRTPDTSPFRDWSEQPGARPWEASICCIAPRRRSAAGSPSTGSSNRPPAPRSTARSCLDSAPLPLYLGRPHGAALTTDQPDRSVAPAGTDLGEELSSWPASARSWRLRRSASGRSPTSGTSLPPTIRRRRGRSR